MILDFSRFSGEKTAQFETRYLHGAGIDQVLAQESSAGEVYWLLADQHDSTREIIDSDGIVLNQIQYDSFGNIISQTNSEVESRYLFTGRELDKESSQYFYRARYYDSKIGRFLSEDPIGFSSGTANLYEYVANNPTSAVDPMGTARTVGQLASPFSRRLKYRLGKDATEYDITFLVPEFIPTDFLLNGDLLTNGSLTVGQRTYTLQDPSRFFGATKSIRILSDVTEVELAYRKANFSTAYPSPRNILGQKAVNSTGRKDQRGHIVPFLLIGNVKGKGTRSGNFFWQDATVNQGTYRTFGKDVADSWESSIPEDKRTSLCCKKGRPTEHLLKYRAELSYGGNNFSALNPFRPGSIFASASFDDESFSTGRLPNSLLPGWSPD